MIVMREILNVKQTQVDPGDPTKGGSGNHVDDCREQPFSLLWKTMADTSRTWWSGITNDPRKILSIADFSALSCPLQLCEQLDRVSFAERECARVVHCDPFLEE